MSALASFDLDLDFGLAGEGQVQAALEGDGTIEVKTERQHWRRTGNLAIEIRYRGKPSGLYATHATWWLHALSEDGRTVGAILVPVVRLRRIVLELWRSGSVRVVRGGDNNWSQLVLVPISELAAAL